MNPYCHACMPTMPTDFFAKARLGSTVWISDVLPAICSWKWNTRLIVVLACKHRSQLTRNKWKIERSKKETYGSSRVVVVWCVVYVLYVFFLYVKVVAVIHQPRYDTLQLFDDLILLAVGGSVVYAGPTEAVPTGKNLPVGWKSWEWHWEICEQYTVNQYKSRFNMTTPERTIICLRNLKLSDFWENNRRRTFIELFCQSSILCHVHLSWTWSVLKILIPSSHARMPLSISKRSYMPCWLDCEMDPLTRFAQEISPKILPPKNH